MKKIEWSEMSKEVGWNEIELEWPTQEKIYELMDRAHSVDRDALVCLLRYCRFLSPKNETERKLMDKMVGILFPCKRMYCD